MSSPWSHAEREQITAKLNELIGPETVQARSGLLASGGQMYYLKIAQARALANDIFGKDQWRTEVRWRHTEEEKSGADNYVVAVSCAVRVTLRDGTYREDVGFCVVEGPTRAETMRKADSIAATDATKRALRLFGPALGNCLYDSNYTRWLAGNPAAP